MYMYLGGAVVPEDDIIGVFDLDNASSSKLTREFLRKREENGELVNLAEGLPRYFVVIKSGGKSEKTYLTQAKMRSITQK